MERRKTRKIKDRRRGPDILIKGISYISIFSWIMIFIIFLVISIAQPPKESFFDRQYNIQVHSNWDQKMIQIAFSLMYPIMVICAFGLLINTLRHQRKTDSYNKSLVIIFCLSLVGIIIHLSFFT